MLCCSCCSHLLCHSCCSCLLLLFSCCHNCVGLNGVKKSSGFAMLVVFFCHSSVFPAVSLLPCFPLVTAYLINLSPHFHSVLLPIFVETHSLSASLSPWPGFPFWTASSACCHLYLYVCWCSLILQPLLFLSFNPSSSSFIHCCLMNFSSSWCLFLHRFQVYFYVCKEF